MVLSPNEISVKDTPNFHKLMAPYDQDALPSSRYPLITGKNDRVVTWATLPVIICDFVTNFQSRPASFFSSVFHLSHCQFMVMAADVIFIAHWQNNNF